MIQELTSIVGENNILAQGKEKTRFTHIWKTDIPLTALAVVFPKSTKEVAAIMHLCNKHNQEVVVHGGVTNLVGGTQSQAKQLVISLEKMNQIEEIDEKSRTITVEAGVILEMPSMQRTTKTSFSRSVLVQKALHKLVEWYLPMQVVYVFFAMG